MDVYCMKYIIAAVILYVLYFLMCYLGTGTEKKNMRSTNFCSYPETIQDQIRADARLKRMVPARRNAVVSFLSNLILFTAVFVLIGLILHVGSFAGSGNGTAEACSLLGSSGRAFLYFLFLGEGLNLFDLVVIDLIWWRHSPRVSIEGIGRAEDYLDPSKHVRSFLRAIPMFALAAVLAARILRVAG